MRVVLRGGTVVDGTGNPGFTADVAIADGRITEIGPSLQGDTEIDASGRIVAPGFIDIHTHYDAQVFWDPALTPSCYHGVTTVVAGNCGFSIAPTRADHHELVARTMENVEDMDVATLAAGIPWDFETFPEYLESVGRHGSALNFTAYIGHTPLRMFVMGEEAYEREATASEIDKMRAEIAAAMDAGAAGFATSFAMTHRGVDGKPIPSRWAAPEEVRALVDVVSESGRGLIATVPGGDFGFDALYNLEADIKVPLTWSALLTQPGGGHLDRLAYNRDKRAAGHNVWPQVTPRPLTFEMTASEPFTLNMNSVFAELMTVGHDERLAAYADPAWRERAAAQFTGKLGKATRWDAYSVSRSATDAAAVDRPLDEVAAERGTSPLDTLLDIAVADGLETRIRNVLANGDDEGIAELLQDDMCTLGLSDAGAHVTQLCDAPQATDFLGRWVRDRELMPIEKAVRKLTGVQADLFNFVGRGYLAEGNAADVCVFDPDTIGAGPTRRVRDFPADAERLTADAPTGVDYVIVNGQIVVDHGNLVEETVEARPGQLVSPAVRTS